LLKQILAVIKKDVALEWRNKFTLAGIFVQVLTAIFIVYLTIPAMNIAIQNSLFWIILIFSSLNAISKGFIAEPQELQLYYSQLVPPKVIIRGKLIYNFALMAIITLLVWLVFNLLINGFSGSGSYYVITVLLTGAGLSSTFTLMSSLVKQVGNAFLIIPVISLPIIIPILLVGLASSKKALDGLGFEYISKEWLILGALTLFSVVMTELLYGILEKN
jgi:heme exporter protein B